MNKLFCRGRQGLGNDFQVGRGGVGGGKGTATRKLPTSRFKFFLRFPSLNFEDVYAKQKNFKYF